MPTSQKERLFRFWKHHIGPWPSAAIIAFILVITVVLFILIGFTDFFSRPLKISFFDWFIIESSEQKEAEQKTIAVKKEAVDKDSKEGKTPNLTYAQASYQLGISYFDGNGIQQNYKEAILNLRNAAKLGHSKAQAKLARIYDYGEGVEPNYKEAANWYRLAANQGDSFSQYNLGNMYLNGKGVEKNTSQAYKWFVEAAKKNDVHAQYALGYMYGKGEGISTQPQEAVKWYRKAVTQKLPEAMVALGEAYYYENGIKIKESLSSSIWDIFFKPSYGFEPEPPPTNKKIAFKLWKEAADLGSIDAKRQLGFAYHNNDNVGISYIKAIEYLMESEAYKVIASLCVSRWDHDCALKYAAKAEKNGEKGYIEKVRKRIKIMREVIKARTTPRASE